MCFVVSPFLIIKGNYSVAVMYLPIKTIKTAGTSIPINGTNRDGNQLATISEDITLIYL